MTDWVAECGSNHNGEKARALGLVLAAHSCGCTAVKFQVFTRARLYADGHGPDPLHELPVAWLPDLAAMARGLGMRFGCSVFDMDGLAMAAPHCDFLKISSYSLLDARLLRACGRAGLPLVVSTGMSTFDELSAALGSARAGAGDAGLGRCQFDITLLHCVSRYPVAAQDCHLALIKTLSDSFGRPVGWSDHSADDEVVRRAVLRWRAPMVELHLDLDGLGAEAAGRHCWTPHRLALLIQGLQRGADADGPALASRMPLDCELPELNWRADPADGLRPMRSAR